MNVNGKATRSIVLASDGWAAVIIDQTRLPHEFVLRRRSEEHTSELQSH